MPCHSEGPGIWLSVWRFLLTHGERGGSVVECRTPEREVRGSRPTAAVLCPWARHFTPRKYWLITQEAMAPSRHDWKIVDWYVKLQHNQPTSWLTVVWASSGGSGETAQMRRLAWTFAACIGDKYQIRLTRPNWKWILKSLYNYDIVLPDLFCLICF